MQCTLPFLMPLHSMGNQRWFHGRDQYRPSQEPFDPTKHGVERISYSQAKSFVIEHHYSGAMVYTIAAYGLFRKESFDLPSQLVGVAVFATPSNPASISKWSGLETVAGAELGRFVLLDFVEGNAETWFLARALKTFKKDHPEKKVILSYSDPVRRCNHLGEIVFPGHTGSIYAASNAYYLGRASPKTLYLGPDGRAVANRIFSKIANGEQGSNYSAKLLIEATKLDFLPDESPREYVRRAKESLRQIPHRGNHLYLFPLASDRRELRSLIQTPALANHLDRFRPYPKQVDSLQAIC